MMSPSIKSLACSVCFDDSSELLTPTKEKEKRAKTATPDCRTWMNGLVSEL